MKISFDEQCKISLQGGQDERDNFCIVECLSKEPMIQRCFVLAVAATISALPPAPTRQQILDCIQSIVEAFRKLEALSTSSIRGLWGELLVLAMAKEPETMLDGWHDDIFEKFDFSIGSEKLEVKTCDSDLRLHDFSLGQLQPVDGRQICIASIELQRSSAGVGIMELASSIETRLSSSSARIAKLWQQVLGTLSRDIETSMPLKYDMNYAKEKLAILDSALIPCPIVPDGMPISNVRFTVALGTVVSTMDLNSTTAELWRRRLNL